MASEMTNFGVFASGGAEVLPARPISTSTNLFDIVIDFSTKESISVWRSATELDSTDEQI